MIISVLKKEAKNNLKGKWKKAILFMMVSTLITILVTFLRDWIGINTPYRLLAIIFNIIITIALNYGILASFIKLKRNEKVSCFHFIYYAGRDGDKLWRLLGRLALRMLLYIIGFILAVYLVVTEVISLYYGYGIRLSFFVEIIALIAITIFFSMQMLYYSLNNYILFDNNKQKAKEILDESKRLMTNHRWDFVKLSLSFAGWFLLAIIFSIGIVLALYFFAGINSYWLIHITNIPLIFLMPYFYMTSICFYDNLLYNNPKPKDEEINNKKQKKKKIKNKTNKKK